MIKGLTPESHRMMELAKAWFEAFDAMQKARKLPNLTEEEKRFIRDIGTHTAAAAYTPDLMERGESPDYLVEQFRYQLIHSMRVYRGRNGT